MTDVQVKCRECGEITELPVGEWQRLKREGVVESSRGRYDFWTCGKHNSKSRGKKSREKAPTKEKAKPTPTNDRQRNSKTTKKQAPKPKKSNNPPAKLTSSGLYFVESKSFPPTITLEDEREFVLVLPYSGKSTKMTCNELSDLNVDSKVAVNEDSASAVYADSKTFEYVWSSIRGHGQILIYKDIDNPPKRLKIRVKGKLISIKHLCRVRGTVREIEKAIFNTDPEVTSYYKAKVFGIGGKYLRKTFDIFLDKDSKKQSKKVPKLSKDYIKYEKLTGMPPHCNACTSPTCENVGMGDDACPAFRSGL